MSCHITVATNRLGTSYFPMIDVSQAEHECSFTLSAACVDKLKDIAASNETNLELTLYKVIVMGMFRIRIQQQQNQVSDMWQPDEVTLPVDKMSASS